MEKKYFLGGLNYPSKLPLSYQIRHLLVTTPLEAFKKRGVKFAKPIFLFFGGGFFSRAISLGRVLVLCRFSGWRDPLVQIDRQTSYYFIIRINSFLYILTFIYILLWPSISHNKNETMHNLYIQNLLPSHVHKYSKWTNKMDLLLLGSFTRLSWTLIKWNLLK